MRFNLEVTTTPQRPLRNYTTKNSLALPARVNIASFLCAYCAPVHKKPTYS